MAGHRLAEMARAAGGTLTGPDRNVRYLSIDSRQPFDPDHTLFVALTGQNHDGHRYLGQLRQKGLHCFMVEHAGQLLPGDSAIVVEDSLKALQALAAWHRAQFSLPVVGITGSNGKTVVKEWLYQLLSGSEHIVRSPGSWNSQVGVPLSVWQIGAQHSLGLFEAGISQPGEMDALERMIAPDVGIFTNLGPAHGASFSSDAEKAAEKARLFRHAKCVVHCTHHVAVVQALEELPGVQLLGWGRGPEARLRILDQVHGEASTRLALEWEGVRFNVTLPFRDEASVENAMHCAATMLHLGHGVEELVRGMHGLQPVSMRLQTMAGANNTTLLNDAYSNDLASLTVSLAHLARTAAGRPRTVVLSDLGESGEAPEQQYGRIAAMLRDAGTGQFIGVGPALQAQAGQFPANSLFFPDAAALLAAHGNPPVHGAVVLVKGARRFGLEKVVEHWEERSHGTVMEVDAEALRHNLNHYREQCGPNVRIMAMVKAGGYGGGAVEMARFFAHEGVAWLGVAYADEGIELRRQGIQVPILVMNPEPVPMETLYRHGLEVEVYDQRSLQAAAQFARQVPDAPGVHLKLDTGMHRLGFMAGDLSELHAALRENPQLKVTSIFSHLAASEDPAQDHFTRAQVQQFRTWAEALIGTLGYRPLLHIANSAAATRFPEARLDMVRLGIGLHGIGADAAETAQLRAVETLRTVVAQVKDVQRGETVGYGRTAILEEPARIAILPIGYADGLPRLLGHGRGRVWIAGKPAHTVGTICMDMCMVNVTDIPCRPGDDAIVFSPEHPLQQYAKDLGTIPYEALTAISPRVKRVFVRE